MNSFERLELLKMDLQIMSATFDDYLQHLMITADKMIEREGIDLTGEIDVEHVQIMYAAYLYRKRADATLGMPRMLRYALNNLLISQKMRGDNNA